MLSNTHFALAVHILTSLAYAQDRVLSSATLAQTTGANPSFLRRIVGHLKEAGLVDTRLGSGGGILLAQRPSAITLRDVYRAVETDPAVPSHGYDPAGPCIIARRMDDLLHDVNRRIDGALADVLSDVTLADLVQRHLPPRRVAAS